MCQATCKSSYLAQSLPYGKFDEPKTKDALPFARFAITGRQVGQREIGDHALVLRGSLLLVPNFLPNILLRGNVACFGVSGSDLIWSHEMP